MSEVRSTAALAATVPARRFHRAGEGLPASAGATPFRARALRRCGGCLLLSHPSTRITRLSPFAGAETSTTRLAVGGQQGLSQ